jgi:pimeloyl-ACP methyl ester carboxylesterase
MFTGMAQNPDAFPPDVLARYRENASKPGAMTAMLNYYRANALAFVKSAPPEPVHVPTLMIWGEHDTALGLELTEGYEGFVGDFTLRRLPQASHWVQQDAPDAVNAEVAGWLTGRGLLQGVLLG